MAVPGHWHNLKYINLHFSLQCKDNVGNKYLINLQENIFDVNKIKLMNKHLLVSETCDKKHTHGPQKVVLCDRWSFKWGTNV